MGSNGSVVSQGTDISSAISKNSRLASEIQALQESEDAVEEHNSNKETSALSNGTTKGKLIVAEEIQQGHVTWKAMKLFFSSLGGDRSILFFLLYSTGLLVTDLGIMSQSYFLGYWGSQYVERNPEEINPFLCVALRQMCLLTHLRFIASYLGGYSLIVIVLILAYFSSSIFYLHGVVRACVSIHKQLMDAILGTTFRYFVFSCVPYASLMSRKP